MKALPFLLRCSVLLCSFLLVAPHFRFRLLAHPPVPPSVDCLLSPDTSATKCSLESEENPLRKRTLFYERKRNTIARGHVDSDSDYNTRWPNSLELGVRTDFLSSIQHASLYSTIECGAVVNDAFWQTKHFAYYCYPFSKARIAIVTAPTQTNAFFLCTSHTCS